MDWVGNWGGGIVQLSEPKGVGCVGEHCVCVRAWYWAGLVGVDYSLAGHDTWPAATGTDRPSFKVYFDLRSFFFETLALLRRASF